MALLSDWVAHFTGSERPLSNLLDDETLLGLALAAARFYAGYADFVASPGVSEIEASTEVSLSEWALIKPLFLLYVERETAVHLEASRGFGVDAFGRSSAEVASDIAQLEANLPQLAFQQPIITI